MTFLVAMAANQMVQGLGGVVAGTARSVAAAKEKIRQPRLDYVMLDVNLNGHLSFEEAWKLSFRGGPPPLASDQKPQKARSVPRANKRSFSRCVNQTASLTDIARLLMPAICFQGGIRLAWTPLKTPMRRGRKQTTQEHEENSIAPTDRMQLEKSRNGSCLVRALSLSGMSESCRKLFARQV